jgi:PKD repeat protein
MNENSHTHFSASAEDYNEDALTYSWKLDGVEKSTSQSWTYNADYNSAGNYNVTVTVSDGQLTASQEWNLTVQNVNRAPVLDNIADITAYEGDTITLNPSASDADGESIAYTYSEWMDSNSKPANYSDAGIHSVTVTASDGNLSDTKQIAVTILNSYEFRTAIADRETKERLEGAAAIAGTEKSVDKTNSTIFDYAHSDVEYNIVYSSSGYQTDNYPIYFDNRLADCAQGTDCLMEGAITSDCKWKAEHLGWLCRLTKEGWEYASYFDFVPSENAAKRIDYMIN